MERQELSLGGESTSDGELVSVVTFMDAGGEVRTLTAGEGGEEKTDTLAFTQRRPSRRVDFEEEKVEGEDP